MQVTQVRVLEEFECDGACLVGTTYEEILKVKIDDMMILSEANPSKSPRKHAISGYDSSQHTNTGADRPARRTDNTPPDWGYAAEYPMSLSRIHGLLSRIIGQILRPQRRRYRRRWRRHKQRCNEGVCEREGWGIMIGGAARLVYGVAWVGAAGGVEVTANGRGDAQSLLLAGQGLEAELSDRRMHHQNTGKEQDIKPAREIICKQSERIPHLRDSNAPLNKYPNESRILPSHDLAKTIQTNSTNAQIPNKIPPPFNEALNRGIYLFEKPDKGNRERRMEGRNERRLHETVRLQTMSWIISKQLPVRLLIWKN
ncbi:hypothetical protein C8J56DRAFT_902203 [Mycena floridula]|nr:hypothetical protein C8J56DRAFT_902203 [Mycena floridula]